MLEFQKINEIKSILRIAFMNAVYGVNTENGLTLILHTSSGATGSVGSIVEYLYSKFKRMNVVVP